MRVNPILPISYIDKDRKQSKTPEELRRIFQSLRITRLRMAKHIEYAKKQENSVYLNTLESKGILYDKFI